MISFRQQGDFSSLTKFFERIKGKLHLSMLDKYGKLGVDALKSATPTETGKTAESWSYEITNNGSSAVISFINTNINKGVNIAIILQYGHGTGTGGYVEGRDYINPAIQPVFDELANEAWKEVIGL